MCAWSCACARAFVCVVCEPTTKEGTIPELNKLQ